jgi:hypothetical protein
VVRVQVRIKARFRVTVRVLGIVMLRVRVIITFALTHNPISTLTLTPPKPHSNPN